MIRSTLLLLSIGATMAMHGQWTVPTVVEMNGDQPADRRVTGLAAPEAEDHGASLHTDRYRTASSGTTQGGQSLTLELMPALSAYAPGLRLTIFPSEANDGPVSLQVDGLPSVAVLKHITEELDSADLRPGVPTDLVFDGVAFQVTNQLYPACPPGFIPIGPDVCMEITSREPWNFYGASYYCGQEGYRLCSFSEFIQGCRMPGGIIGSIVDYEWVDEAANHVNYAKLMGNSDVLGIDCRAGSLRIPTAHARYRCCTGR